MYHGEDFRFRYGSPFDVLSQLKFYSGSLRRYDIFHFSNAHALSFGPYVQQCFGWFGESSEIRLLKKLGKKIVYSTNGCLDGASQSSFSRWGPDSPCEFCNWRTDPSVCSDERNLAWGKLRNGLADYIVSCDYSLSDFNFSPKLHFEPRFYCLDPEFWRPDLLIPANYRVPCSKDTVKLFHSVSNFDRRGVRNVKCTHIYLPLVEQLKREGFNVELTFFHDVPNKNLRFYQAQCDIVVDMLTFGWFGGNVREAMMLGKPAVCFLRPEWLEYMRRQLPEYVDELPVVSATPRTIHDVLVDLIQQPDKRREIGNRSRIFALKWHSAEAAAKRFDQTYSGLLNKS